MAKVFFEKSVSESLSVNNDSINLTTYHQLLKFPFYQTDSIISLTLNRSLIIINRIGKLLPVSTNKYSVKSTLKNGDRIVVIDSSYNINSTSSATVHKLSIIDRNENRRWTYEVPQNVLMGSTPQVLSNGTFLLQALSKWVNNRVYDTISIIQFDTNGRHEVIKNYLDGANPGMENYFVFKIFEGRENEIWVFYQKRYPKLQERLYFEKIRLSK